MTDSDLQSYTLAMQDFHRARRKAALGKLLDRIGRNSPPLLPYDEVVRKLGGQESGRWELREVPLISIVGSVGRYQDFTRDFLPLRDSDASRWASVQVAMTGLVGLPPVELYQVGEAYFVRDGNHRISVARQLGATQIQAYVNQVQTKVPLSAEADLDELIIKSEMAEFLKRTRLDETRPGTDFTVTAPGRYHELEHQIRRQAEQPAGELPNLARRWHDQTYLPVLDRIRELGMLREFPGRTETDLYVWVMKHRAELEEALAWTIAPQSAAEDLISRLSAGARRRLARREQTAQQLARGERAARQAPTMDEPGTAPRQQVVSDVLVPISGDADDWVALHQAVILAVREEARVLGLHVSRSDRKAHSQRAQAVHVAFESQCTAKQWACEIAFAVGKVAPTICERARWADLVVTKLNHPPDRRAVQKLSSGFRTLLRGCPRPVLAVPRGESQLSHLLLAYDSSPKADEALYLAAYFAGRWQVPLTVVSVGEGGEDAEGALEAASRYLNERGVSHTEVAEAGPVAPAILRTADQYGADLLITGGYGRGAVAEVVLGSTVDELLRASEIPILICH